MHSSPTFWSNPEGTIRSYTVGDRLLPPNFIGGSCFLSSCHYTLLIECMLGQLYLVFSPCASIEADAILNVCRERGQYFISGGVGVVNDIHSKQQNSFVTSFTYIASHGSRYIVSLTKLHQNTYRFVVQIKSTVSVIITTSRCTIYSNLQYTTTYSSLIRTRCITIR